MANTEGAPAPTNAPPRTTAPGPVNSLRARDSGIILAVALGACGLILMIVFGGFVAACIAFGAAAAAVVGFTAYDLLTDKRPSTPETATSKVGQRETGPMPGTRTQQERNEPTERQTTDRNIAPMREVSDAQALDELRDVIEGPGFDTLSPKFQSELLEFATRACSAHAARIAMVEFATPACTAHAASIASVAEVNDHPNGEPVPTQELQKIAGRTQAEKAATAGELIAICNLQAAIEQRAPQRSEDFFAYIEKLRETFQSPEFDAISPAERSKLVQSARIMCQTHTKRIMARMIEAANHSNGQPVPQQLQRQLEAIQVLQNLIEQRAAQISKAQTVSKSRENDRAL